MLLELLIHVSLKENTFDSSVRYLLQFSLEKILLCFTPIKQQLGQFSDNKDLPAWQLFSDVDTECS